MTRPARACIDLQALANNLFVARSIAGSSRIMAVVKADAYGHGLVPVARALDAADALAVASLEEALQLREAGVQNAIVLLEGVFEAAELKPAIQHQLQLVVHHERQLRWLQELRTDVPLHLWLKVNTGMNRLGFRPEQAAQAWQRLQALPQVQQGSLRWMSHLACADDKRHVMTDKQLQCFREITDGVKAQRSLANSAALLSRPDTHFDWVRPGIMLYGASPMIPGTAPGVDLRPVMTLESRLISVQQGRRGESIGYGASWNCPADMPFGVVAIGYGDGYPRHAPSGTAVLVNGQQTPLVGRVSMDMICVDLREQPHAKPGDPVVLWGAGLTAETLAVASGTISYELFCGVTSRVPRIYQ